YELHGVDNDVAVRACVADDDHGLLAETELAERVEGLVDGGRLLLVHRSLCFAGGMLNHNGDVGGAVGVGGVGDAHFELAGFGDSKLVGGGEVAFIGVVVVEVAGADVAADRAAFAPAS